MVMAGRVEDLGVAGWEAVLAAARVAETVEMVVVGKARGAVVGMVMARAVAAVKAEGVGGVAVEATGDCKGCPLVWPAEAAPMVVVAKAGRVGLGVVVARPMVVASNREAERVLRQPALPAPLLRSHQLPLLSKR